MKKITKAQAKKEYLDDVVKSFQKMVHASGCKKLNACPKGHTKCKRKLTDKTALMWEVATTVGSFRMWGSPKETIAKLHTLCVVLSQHNERLGRMVNDIRAVIEYSDYTWQSWVGTKRRSLMSEDYRITGRNVK